MLESARLTRAIWQRSITTAAAAGTPRIHFSHFSAYGRGAGVGRDLGVGVDLGVTVGSGVPVAVAVGVAVAAGVTVGVGVEFGTAAQYLPPVLKSVMLSAPPQTIISLPVQTDSDPGTYRGVGALVVLVADQLSVVGLYLPPVLK